jgi:hypothetical protein
MKWKDLLQGVEELCSQNLVPRQKGQGCKGTVYSPIVSELFFALLRHMISQVTLLHIPSH